MKVLEELADFYAEQLREFIDTGSHSLAFGALESLLKDRSQERLRLLEKWWEEAEKRLADFNYELQLEELCNQDSRNDALEEAAQVADGWCDGALIAKEIRALKEEEK